MRWFTGELKLDLRDDGGWTMRTPGSGERSSANLLKYHDQLLSKLDSEEAKGSRGRLGWLPTPLAKKQMRVLAVLRAT